MITNLSKYKGPKRVDGSIDYHGSSEAAHVNHADSDCKYAPAQDLTIYE